MNLDCCLDDRERGGVDILGHTIARSHCPQVLGDSGGRGAFPVQKLSPLDSPPATIS
jgi:hypothetical protein